MKTHDADATGLRWGSQFTASRHVPDGGGAGYLVEDTHWYPLQGPGGLVLCNQDGEGAHFEAWKPQAEAMQAGLFTPEACWVSLQVLARG